jgi:hypothetical protein
LLVRDIMQVVLNQLVKEASEVNPADLQTHGTAGCHCACIAIQRERTLVRSKSSSPER